MQNIAIPNMLNGVSQQPPSVRFPTQGERQVNAYSSPVEGLIKRPPTEHVAQVAPITDAGYSLGADAYATHLIDRGDDQEVYGILMRKAAGATATDAIRVVDLNNNGASVPVFYPANGAAYLTGSPTTAAEDLEFLTVGDVTLVLNRRVTTAMKTTRSPVRTPEAIIWISGVTYGEKLAVSIKIGAGAEQTVNYTTASSTRPVQQNDVTTDGETFLKDASTLDASYVAARLTDALRSNGTINAAFSIVRRANVIYLKTTGATPPNFTLSVRDGNFGNSVRAVKEFVPIFQELPILAPEGFVVRIDGQPEEDRDDYFVRFKQTQGSTSTPDQGVWEETVAPDTLLEIDPVTMPHALLRYFDGSGNPYFVFKPIDGVQMIVGGNPLIASDIKWQPRIAGSSLTNPLPSFIGQPITDMFLFKNRLGFLAGESVVLSESGEFFNYFRTTVTSLLDTTPIDLISSYPGVTLFRSAVPFQDRLLLFAEKVQMDLTTDRQALQPLTVRTAALNIVSNFDYLPTCAPSLVNDAVFFPFDRGGFTGVRNMLVSTADSRLLLAPDISAHVPQYIQGKARLMAASAHDNLLVVKTDRRPNTLYIYKWFDRDDERVQSSWSEWTFRNAELIGMGWQQSSLWVFMKRADGIFLEKIILQPDRKDDEETFVTHLDRRIRLELADFDPSGPDTLWATVPYEIVPEITPSGDFGVFRVGSTSFQTAYDIVKDTPVNLEPPGNTVSTQAFPDATPQTYGALNLATSVADPSETRLFSRYTFVLNPKGSLKIDLPDYRIPSGFVNSPIINSFRAYVTIISERIPAKSFRFLSKQGSSLLEPGEGLACGWNISETGAGYSGTVNFRNDGRVAVRFQIVLEKQVDAIVEFTEDQVITLKFPPTGTGLNASHWSHIAYGAGKYVALNERSTATGDFFPTGSPGSWSVDGLSWTEIPPLRTTPGGLPEVRWAGIIYSEHLEKFIAVASRQNGSATGKASVVYSSDGVVWTAATGNGFNLDDIAQVGSSPYRWKSIAEGENGRLVIQADRTLNGVSTVWSDDGIVWNAAATPPAASAASSNVVFGRVIQSTVTPPFFEVIPRFVFVTATTAWSSSDGNVWSSASHGMTGLPSTLVLGSSGIPGDHQFVLGTSTGYRTSSTGLAWSAVKPVTRSGTALSGLIHRSISWIEDRWISLTQTPIPSEPNYPDKLSTIHVSQTGETWAGFPPVLFQDDFPEFGNFTDAQRPEWRAQAFAPTVGPANGRLILVQFPLAFTVTGYVARVGQTGAQAYIDIDDGSLPVQLGSWKATHQRMIEALTIIRIPLELYGDGKPIALCRDENGLPIIEILPNGNSRICIEFPLFSDLADFDRIKFWAGEPYEMLYEFSVPYIRQEDNTVITTGRTQIRRMGVIYDGSGYFCAIVENTETGSIYEYHKDYTIGYNESPGAGIDTPNLTDGTLWFPVMVRNTNLRVTLSNSSIFPSRFVGAEVEASYDARARRI